MTLHQCERNAELTQSAPYINHYSKETFRSRAIIPLRLLPILSPTASGYVVEREEVGSCTVYYRAPHIRIEETMNVHNRGIYCPCSPPDVKGGTE